MPKYKVCFEGFSYVTADDPNEAFEKAQDGDTDYEETQFQLPIEVDDFGVEV